MVLLLWSVCLKPAISRQAYPERYHHSHSLSPLSFLLRLYTLVVVVVLERSGARYCQSPIVTRIQSFAFSFVCTHTKDTGTLRVGVYCVPNETSRQSECVCGYSRRRIMREREQVSENELGINHHQRQITAAAAAAFVYCVQLRERESEEKRQRPRQRHLSAKELFLKGGYGGNQRIISLCLHLSCCYLSTSTLLLIVFLPTT